MAIVVILALVVSGIVVISVISSQHFEKRVQGHSGVSREVFIRHFAVQGVPPAVSGTVYDTFKAKVKSKKFMPSPEMPIEKVFEQLGEDTDDDALYILKTLGIPKPTDATLESWPGEGIQTISDLVMWTDWVRRHQ